MLNRRIRGALVALAASAGLAACTNMGPFGGVGVGIGSQYGNPYGYSPYGYGYGSPYGSYYGGYPYFGWHNGFYYPGSGYWVYDPDGHPSPITEDQRNYWSNMLAKFREKRGANAEAKANFSGFRSRARAGATIAGVDLNAQAQADQGSLDQVRQARRQARIERQQAQAERSQARSERQESMREVMQERRESRRARRDGGGN